MPVGHATKAKCFVTIFFLSGVAGLAYQVVWAKTFAASIGHEYPAMLAVVSAFMCGMAAGNFILVRFRRLSPRSYGGLELMIGVWAVLVTMSTPRIEAITHEILGLAPSPVKHWMVVFSVVFISLFPATSAMGATLAAAERFLGAILQRPTTALLYGANTAGAMIGALLAAFWIMPVFGLWTGSMLLAAVNISCGIAALLLAQSERSAKSAEGEPCTERNLSPGLVVQLFCTGLVGIGFEVAIVRGLSQVLENTVYTFAVVLATYLGGTALGAFLYHRLPRARVFKDPALLFAGLAVTSLLASLALRWIPPTYQWLRFSLGDSLPAVAVAEALVAGTSLLLPCVFMGATWSCLAQRSLQFKPNLAPAVFLNTLGAAAAPVIWGLLLIRVFGLKGALAVVPCAYAAISVSIPGRARLGVLVFIACAAASPWITSNRELIETGGGRIISLEEGVMGSVAVIESTNSARVLKFNNRFQMGGTAARIAEQRQADIPLLLHRNPKQALFIGLGTGISFATAAFYPDLIADGVELVPEIAQAMPLFNDSTLSSTNLITHVADGRRFVRATTNRYDVIVADLFHPAQDGAGFLYTREHFEGIRDRLTEGGLFCQWLPLHQMDLDTFAIIKRTFETVFPNAQQWLLRFSIDTPVVGLIGPGGEWMGALEARMLNDTHLAEHLRSVGLADLVRLFGCYLGESALYPSGELNTDSNPAVIFRAPAITFQRNDEPGERLLALIKTAETGIDRAPWSPHRFPRSLPQEVDLQTEIPKFIRARDVYLKGLLHESRGRLDDALAAFIESARISSHFTAGYAQALTLATTLAKSNPQSARAILETLIAAQPERPVARELLERLQNPN